MTNSDDAGVQLVNERFERRLSEECGALRVDIATEFGRFRSDMATQFGLFRTENAREFGLFRAEMAAGLGQVRPELIDRDAKQLKWALVFAATQTAALAAVMVALR